MKPPVVSDEALDGWAVVAETTETAFSVGPISVVAHIRRYEPADTPTPRPFFFVSRLTITPRTRPNAALTRLVERGAREEFRSTLVERGIDDLSRDDIQALRIEDSEAAEATLTTFHGRYRPDDPNAGMRPVPVLALLATWTTAVTDEYLLAGGAVPAGGDTDLEAGRRRLVRMIRSVRAE